MSISGFFKTTIVEFVDQHVASKTYERLYIKSINSIEDFDCCNICLVDFEEMERIKILECGHLKHFFHQKCLTNWMMIKTECPLCRHNYREKVKKMKRKTI
jgi:hypothetical protein